MTLFMICGWTLIFILQMREKEISKTIFVCMWISLMCNLLQKLI